MLSDNIEAPEIDMSQQPLMEHYRVADYQDWQGDWELIGGTALAMAPSPGLHHQRASMRIARQLDEALDGCPSCEVLFETDVELTDDTVVRPDVLVICYPPEGERLNRAPEIIFEVVSNKTARRDEVTKLRLYAEERVTHYTLVYPELKKAKVYRLVDGAYRKVGDFQDEDHDFELSKCRIHFDFSRIWKRP